MSLMVKQPQKTKFSTQQKMKPLTLTRITKIKPIEQRHKQEAVSEQEQKVSAKFLNFNYLTIWL